MVHRFARLSNTLLRVRTLTQHPAWLPCMVATLLCLNIAPATFTFAADSNNAVHGKRVDAPKQTPDLQVQCLPGGGAFLRARLSGVIDAELSWNDRNLSCAGSVRPNDEGIRLRFAAANGEHRLVLLFGISGLKEGQSGKALPTNLTIMREGTGEFYGTQGDNKCTIDDISQQPLQGVPLKLRAYRVTARGFCIQPARALNGDGAILVTRFDFSGRADFVSDDSSSSSHASAHSVLPTT
jgi:hypothetical protein